MDYHGKRKSDLWTGMLLTLGMILCTSISARADEDGRYRAIVLHEGEDPTSPAH